MLVSLAYAATLVLFVLANKLTTAASTIFLQDTAPVYILLLSPVLLNEPIRRRDLGFMLVIGIGMALFFVGRQQTFVTAPDPVRGNILATLSGITYALMLIGMRWMGKRGGSPASAVGLGNLFAFLIALPAILPLGHHSVTDWSIILYLGVFQIGLAYLWLTRGIQQLPGSRSLAAALPRAGAESPLGLAGARRGAGSRCGARRRHSSWVRPASKHGGTPLD